MAGSTGDRDGEASHALESVLVLREGAHLLDCDREEALHLLRGVVSDPKMPECPYCQSTLKPERISAERWVCSCCSRVFVHLPTQPKE